eukprot:5558720-Amphidinium_carterae.1
MANRLQTLIADWVSITHQYTTKANKDERRSQSSATTSQEFCDSALHRDRRGVVYFPNNGKLTARFQEH